MNTSLVTTLLGIGALLFLFASIWLAWVNVYIHKRWYWALFSASFLLIASGLARIAYLFSQNLLPLIAADLPTILMASAAAVFAAAAAIWQHRRSQQDQLIIQSAQNELARYKVHFDQDPRLLLIKDEQGNYLAANPAFANFLGKQMDALIGENDFSYFPRSTANALRQLDEKTLQGKQRTNQEIELIGVAGARWFQLARTPMLNSAGQPIGLLLTGRDLSNERMQQAQNESWQRGVQILLDFGLDLFQNMDAGAPLKKLLPWAERLAETEHAALWCFECDGPQLVLKEAAGKLTDFPVDKLKTGEDLAWKVWKSGQSLFVPDLTVWKDASAWTRKSGLQGALGVPLKSGNQTVYVLAVYYEGLSPALVEPRMGLLELMAQAAFENESILQKIDQLSHSLQTQEQSTAVLQLQARLEHAISMLAAQFINMDAKKIRDAIRLALKTMARTAGVDRAFLAVLPNGVHSRLVDIDLFSATSDPATSTLTYGSGEFLLQPDFRWALEKLNQLEAAYISDANQLPNADKDALPYLRAKQLVGFAAVPLENNRNMTGILGFESHQQALHWPPELLGVLKVAADLFSNLLERQTHLQNEQAERQKMVQQVKQLEQRTHEHALISEMGDLLQACRTADEAYPIIHRYLQRLLPEKSGALYIFQDANDPAEKAVSWGIAAPSESEHELTTNECWALRRGRMYLIKDPQVETLCGHIKEKIQNSYLCVPMLAQGRAIGVLHLRANPGSDQADAFSEDQ